MAGMADYLEDKLRAHLFRTATFAKPAGLYIALHTADPTDTGTGTEVTGGGYARVQRNPGDANWTAGTATDGVTKNVADLVFPAPTGAWGTVTHWGIWDAATGGNLLCTGAMDTPQAVASGTTAPIIPANGLQITFS